MQFRSNLCQHFCDAKKTYNYTNSLKLLYAEDFMQYVVLIRLYTEHRIKPMQVQQHEIIQQLTHALWHHHLKQECFDGLQALLTRVFVQYVLIASVNSISVYGK